MKGYRKSERLAMKRNWKGKWTSRTGISIELWWLTQKIAGAPGMTCSIPSTRTRMPLVLRISHDHTRAQPCCQRPPESTREPASESVPMNAV